MGTVVHVISHSHWDREWYLPFEEHRGKLLTLINECMEAFSAGEDCKSFHLDGQTAVLEDYLEVYPEKKEELKKYVQEGRFHIGPWYILQDEFLTSGEANVRNLLYGIETGKEFGDICKVGYFPDSFGNVGQAPQLMKQAGMEAIAFGRGVRPIGFNNTISENDYTSTYSEMMWESPDGSALMSILFANWYSNGNEIPVEEEAAKKFWDGKLADARKFASTEHLLFMNGCDHQPLQTDLPQALETARKLYPDITFIHSNFPYYVQCVKESLPKETSVVKGELTSQESDGYGTLANTASARNYLKTANREAEVLLEKAAEPISVMAMREGMNYPYEKLRYNWKSLMKNHPHDSICGCSVDPVHREMETRFAKSIQVSNMLVEEGKQYVSSKINTERFREFGDESVPFVVWNTGAWNLKEEMSVDLDLFRINICYPENFHKAEEAELGEWSLVDENGNEIPCTIEDMGARFGYTLPARTFRTSHMARYVKVKFQNEIPAMSYRTYALVPKKKAELAEETLITGTNCMENELLAVQIQPNGAFTVTDKATGKVFKDQGMYEDTGDVGNEYAFKETIGQKPITTEQTAADIRVKEDLPWKAVFEIDQVIQVPEAADESLKRIQEMCYYFTSRKIARGTKMVDLKFHTELTLEKDSNHLDIHVWFENTADDHRVRILFPTDLQTQEHKADSVFEVVTRPNYHSKVWINPSECERNQYFTAMNDDQAGVMIANRGQYEYEILHDRNTIAVTLLRAVGEMGDWGYFPTPEAQCKGRVTEAEIRWVAQTGAQMEADGYAEAIKFQRGFTWMQVPVQEGELPLQKSYLNWNGEGVAMTSYKAAMDGNGIVARFVNLTQEATSLELTHPGTCFRSNVVEETGEELQANAEGTYKVAVGPCEILTLRLC